MSYKFVRPKNGKVSQMSNLWRNWVPRSFRCLQHASTERVIDLCISDNPANRHDYTC